MKRKTIKHLKINLQLFAEGPEDQENFEFEEKTINLNEIEGQDDGSEEYEDDGSEEYEDYEEDNTTNNDYIEDQDQTEDQEEESEGTNENPPQFTPYQTNSWGNDPSQMTEEKAKAIFDEESQLDPVMAWQNYTQNMVKASTQKYESILKKEQFNNELGQLSSRYPDFHDYDTQSLVQQVDQDYTGNNRLPDMAAFEVAYLRSKVQKLEDRSRAAFANGKKAGTQRRTAKKKIHNEISGSKKNSDRGSLPEGINIVSIGDGIFT